MRVRPRVVKVGGSLFEFDGLTAALREWLAHDTPQHTVLLAGGGELAEVIRRADARLGLGEETSHWLCIRLLGVTTRMLNRLLPEVQFVDDFEALKRRLGEPSPISFVFNPEPFLSTIEPRLPGRPLPHNWEATTDSIAARLAEVLDADLALLKSVDPPARTSASADRDAYFAELAATGFVDGHFPAAAASLPFVEMANLRNLGRNPLVGQAANLPITPVTRVP